MKITEEKTDNNRFVLHLLKKGGVKMSKHKRLDLVGEPGAYVPGSQTR